MVYAYGTDRRAGFVQPKERRPGYVDVCNRPVSPTMFAPRLAYGSRVY